MIAARIESEKRFRRAEIIFLNALVPETGGYHKLNSAGERAVWFDRVLEAAAARFEPDAILVACNTLSVLLGDVSFTSRADFPVIGIIEPGVAMLGEAIDRVGQGERASVLLFGTSTTVEAGTHREALLERGFDAGAIASCACPGLVVAIENDPGGGEARGLIEGFVGKALGQIDRRDSTVIIGLNCTHFGYARQLWVDALVAAGVRNPVLIDPNERMANDFLSDYDDCRSEETKVTASVVSMIRLEPGRSQAIGRLIEKISPTMAEALTNYIPMPDLLDEQTNK